MIPALLRTIHRVRNLTRPEVGRIFSSVNARQWLSRDEIDSLAWEKQKKLVTYAYETCAFYREKYDAAGFHPGDLKQAEDFGGVPIIKKADIRESISDIVAKGVNPRRLRKVFTGGSTGTPLMLYHDTQNDLLMNALYYRTIGAWGLKKGLKTAHIWGLNPLNEALVYTKQSPLKRFISNYALLDAFTMTPEKMIGFHSLMNHFKPELVISYTSAMTAFARYVEERGGAMFKPKAIWLTAEPIHDFQKEIIEQVFKSKVYNQYGSVEIFFYASECIERHGLHINADMRTIEVVDEHDRPLTPGVVGKLIVTDLENYAAPLIRYQNEDMASLSDRKCPCGRGLPLMSEVTGRISDMFLFSDGTIMHGEKFTHIVKHKMTDIEQFQVIQKNLKSLEINIVPSSHCDREELKNYVLTEVNKITKSSAHVFLNYVKEIPKEASGKYRFTKSLIDYYENFSKGKQ